MKRSLQTALIVASVTAPISAGAQDRVGVTIAAGAIANRDPDPSALLRSTGALRVYGGGGVRFAFK